MCEPTTILAIVSLAIGAASAAQANKAQTKAANNANQAATTAYNLDNAQLENQRREANVAQRSEMSLRAQQALAERSRLRAAGAEGGLEGNSIDRIYGANEFALGQDMATLTENASNQNRQSSMEGIAGQSRLQSRLNQIERPSNLMTGLQIGSAAFGAYDSYSSGKKTTTSKAAPIIDKSTPAGYY